MTSDKYGSEEADNSIYELGLNDPDAEHVEMYEDEEDDDESEAGSETSGEQPDDITREYSNRTPYFSRALNDINKRGGKN